MGLLVMTGVGLLLRLWRLGTGSPNVDECSSVWTALHPDGVWAALADDTNAPLYFLLLRPWLDLAGISTYALKLPSALLGTLGVPLAGLLAWRLAGGRTDSERQGSGESRSGAADTGSRGPGNERAERGMGFLPGDGARGREEELSGTGHGWGEEAYARWAAVLASAMWALSPLQVFLSRQARGYSLLLALLLGYGLASEAWLVRGRRGALIAAGTLAALALATHNLAVTVLAAPVAGALLVTRWRRRLPGLIVALTLATVAVGPVLGLAWMQSKCPGLDFMKASWRLDPPWVHVGRSLELFGWAGNMPDYMGVLATRRPEAIRWTASALWGMAILLGVCGLGVAVGGTGARSEQGPEREVPRRREALGKHGVPRVHRADQGRSKNPRRRQRTGRARRARDTWSVRVLWRGGRNPEDWARCTTLLGWMVFPLASQVAISLILRPVYLEGRYDVLAQPGAVGLASLGLAGLTLGGTARRWTRGAVLAIPVAWSIMALLPLFLPWSVSQTNVQAAQWIQTNTQPEDPVVVMGLRYPSVWLAMRRVDDGRQLLTFPFWRLNRPGWFRPDLDLLEPGVLDRQVEWLARRGRSMGRLILVIDPFVIYANRGYQEKLTEWLKAGLERKGMQEAGRVPELGVVEYRVAGVK